MDSSALGNSGDALILHNIFDTQTLIASRSWEVLRDGVFISLIYGSDENSPQAAFLHYLPGASVPVHVHKGFEHILILDGAQNDGAKVYSKGTLVIHATGSDHQITSPGGCFALGIWEKPVAFR